MRFKPRFSSFPLPTAALAGLVALFLLTSSGCAKRGPRGDYALPAAQRPLEVPPELNLAANNDGRQGPALASVVQARQQTAATQQPSSPTTTSPPVTSANSANTVAAVNSFTVRGSREDVYNALGQTLAAMEGVSIASRSQMLASFDVTFADSRFLLRVTSSPSGTQVSAVDARGLPISEPAVLQLLEMLRTRL